MIASVKCASSEMTGLLGASVWSRGGQGASGPLGKEGMVFLS